MNDSTENLGLLHIIAQPMSHDEAFIVGTEEGLTRLRNAIDLAIKHKAETHQAALISNDGEGYWGMVRCATEDQMDEIPLGYTEECFHDDRPMPDWITQHIF